MSLNGFSRRDFARAAGAVALGLSAEAARSAGAAAPRQAASAGFPRGFRWGTATSAYQVEGAVNEDGRGPSIWDGFAHMPGRLPTRAMRDIADDHYHRYMWKTSG